MIKNYLKLTFRNLYKNKIFVLINILGLGLALAVCIVSYYNYMFNADFDIQHVHRDEIYKINYTRDIQGRSQVYGISPLALAPLLKNEISENETLVRFFRSNSPLKVGEKNFNKSIGYADANFFNMFNFPLVSGDPSSFKEKGNILISEEMADIYFGDEDPIGEIMSIFNDNREEFTYIVSGVFKNIPQNTTLEFDVLALFETFVDMWEIDETQWQWWVCGTFIHISNPDRTQAIENILSKYIPVQNSAREDYIIESFYLERFKDVPKHSRDMWNHWFTQGLHPAQIVATPIMGILILLIGCFNFTNTAIAFSSRRLKEIGIRRVVGGVRRQLIFQFFGENLLICFFALILSIFFASILVPAYSAMWPYMTITLSLTGNVGFWIFLLVLLLLTGLFAGIYPAFYVSSFEPVKILRGKVQLGRANLFSKILLTFQFCISILALVSGLIFTQNAKFQDNFDMGYDKDNFICVPLWNQSDFIAYRDAVEKNPKITSVGGSSNHLNYSYNSRAVKYLESEFVVDMMNIGHGYFNTVGFTLLDGREFDPLLEKTDLNNSIIVNEKLVEDFGLTDPVGKSITIDDTVKFTIIGVVKNFYIEGFWRPVNPFAFMLSQPDRLYFLVARASTEDLHEVNEFLESEWQQILPNYPYEGFFQEERLAEAKDVNKSIKQIFIFLVIMAVILSIIGLFTLASLNIISRTKEIGIRKVMGSSVRNIILLLHKEFIIILAIASCVGCIGGFFFSGALMESIWDVFTDTNFISYSFPIILTFVIAIITIAGKAYQGASKSPSDSLRYE